MRSESSADRLEIRDQLAGLEVGAAVERHVLDEVREPLLIVGLVERSCLDRQSQRDSLRRLVVPPDHETEAVRERSGPDRRIEWNDFVE